MENLISIGEFASYSRLSQTVEVCVPKAGGERRLPEGEVSLTQISGSQCNFPEILAAYESVYCWAKEHGREPDGPPREIYLAIRPRTRSCAWRSRFRSAGAR